MIRIDTDSYIILVQKYGLPLQKCGMSAIRYSRVGVAILNSYVLRRPREPVFVVDNGYKQPRSFVEDRLSSRDCGSLHSPGSWPRRSRRLSRLYVTVTADSFIHVRVPANIATVVCFKQMTTLIIDRPLSVSSARRRWANHQPTPTRWTQRW